MIDGGGSWVGRSVPGHKNKRVHRPEASCVVDLRDQKLSHRSRAF